MKQITKTLAKLIIISSLFLGTFWVYSPNASAAEAVCFYQTTGSGTSADRPPRQVECNGNIKDVINAQFGYDPQSDHCYLSGRSVQEFPITSQQCANLLEGAGVNTGIEEPTGPTIEESTNATRDELRNCSSEEECLNLNPIVGYAKILINTLSGAVGIIAIAVIVVAGIQYASSSGNPNTTAQAKKRIINAIIALIAFAFMFAMLQWLIPGGIT